MEDDEEQAEEEEKKKQTARRRQTMRWRGTVRPSVTTAKRQQPPD